MKQALILVALLILVTIGCTRQGDQPNIELVQDMMEHPGRRAQEAGKSGMWMPPTGTVPRDFEPYLYKGQPESAERELRNAVPVTEESLKRGKQVYETYCFVCHGLTGKGDGPVAEKMSVKPPALVSAKVKGYNDGRIFHIVTDGQGVMGPYASQIVDPKDRWAVVNYVRTLKGE